MRKCCGVVKSPEVRLTHGGPAEKHGFFSQSDFRTKIAILNYIWEGKIPKEIGKYKVSGGR